DYDTLEICCPVCGLDHEVVVRYGHEWFGVACLVQWQRDRAERRQAILAERAELRTARRRLGNKEAAAARGYIVDGKHDEQRLWAHLWQEHEKAAQAAA